MFLRADLNSTTFQAPRSVCVSLKNRPKLCAWQLIVKDESGVIFLMLLHTLVYFQGRNRTTEGFLSLPLLPLESSALYETNRCNNKE